MTFCYFVFVFCFLCAKQNHDTSTHLQFDSFIFNGHFASLSFLFFFRQHMFCFRLKKNMLFSSKTDKQWNDEFFFSFSFRHLNYKIQRLNMMHEPTKKQNTKRNNNTETCTQFAWCRTYGQWAVSLSLVRDILLPSNKKIASFFILWTHKYEIKRNKTEEER